MMNRIRTIHPDEQAQARRLWDACFDEDSVQWTDWYFQHVYQADHAYGIYDGARLVSMNHMNAYTLMMRGKRIQAHALAGVATDDNYRRQGYAGSLIRHALVAEYANGCEFSFLYPFRYAYYESFGYRLAYKRYQLTAHPHMEQERISLVPFPDNSPIPMMTRRYNQTMLPYNGYVDRDEAYAVRRLKEFQADNYDVQCFTVNDRAGYYIGRKQQDIYSIDELMGAEDLAQTVQDIANTLNMTVVYNHAFPTSSMINETSYDHCMGRVVNFVELFSGMACYPVELCVKINDPILTDNCGLWYLDGRNGQLKVEHTLAQPDFVLDIASLGPIVTGWWDDLGENERCFANRLFPPAIPFIMEVC